VCRRVLHSHEDAEDAFQATFIILFRKAASVQPRSMVANWLHGVALRTALKAQAMAAKREKREMQLASVPEPAPKARPNWPELEPFLDQELGRLPDKYRMVVVLCDLEGRTRKEVASHLRLPEGTVAGRLARARAMLAKRLTRHSLAFSSASLAAALAEHVEATCVPAFLIPATIQSSVSLAAGSLEAGVISAQVAALTKGVLKIMLLTKLKIATAVLLGVAVAGTGVVVFAPSVIGQTQPAKPESPANSAPENTATIHHLIDQLGSSQFAERERASKELGRIGEPALPALRKVETDKDPEVRQRAQSVIRNILNASIDRLLIEEAREDEIYNKKIAAILERTVQIMTERLGPEAGGIPRVPVPLLADAYLRLARARVKLGQNEAAGQAYLQAEHYWDLRSADRQRVDDTRREMMQVVTPVWKKAVRDKIAQEPALKALAAKYPLVMLHSRRYASGHYLQSTYSFLYETADQEKHFNDVQLQFDNGGGDCTFGVNMVTNQTNAVIDLGNVDFNTDPESTKADFKEQVRDRHKAENGHVYLEKVEDTNGNRFFVLFKIVAIDEQSRYMAFIWRRLPGGKVVRARPLGNN
jgi:RNA polymerase sigma factor (sigma-70 family)